MFDDKRWKLTLPIGEKNKPKEVYAPFKNVDKVFEVVDEGPTEGGSFKLTCPVDAVTTPGSSYGRTEFRELDAAGKLASWSNKEGLHAMRLTLSIDGIPHRKPQVVIAQIHDDKDDVFFIRFTGKSATSGLLEVVHDQKHYGKLDENLKLGEEFSCSITATKKETVIIYVKDSTTTKVTLPKLKIRKGYFKAGNYIQSNTQYDKTGESVVTLSSLELMDVPVGYMVGDDELEFLMDICQ